MNLFDEIAAETNSKGPDCKTGQLLEELSKEDRADLERAINSKIAATAIVRVLARRGINLKSDSLRRHRHGECKCHQSATS